MPRDAIFKNQMNNEHEKWRTSLHDFNELEGLRLKRFLNIKGKGTVIQNGVSGPKLELVR
jgi:hypothetical protein